jgi:hypothetical protein
MKLGRSLRSFGKTRGSTGQPAPTI